MALEQPQSTGWSCDKTLSLKQMWCRKEVVAGCRRNQHPLSSLGLQLERVSGVTSHVLLLEVPYLLYLQTNFTQSIRIK